MPYPSKLLQLASLATTVLAVDQQVDLPYTSYNGGAADDVSTWFGVRYAAPPTGNLRFQAPTPPLQEAGTQDATKKGPHCISVGSSVDGSEDCLFVDITMPTAATSDSPVPVYFWIMGGGLQGSGGTGDATQLVKDSNFTIGVVQPTYRVGPHGFLGGNEIKAKGSTNNGFKDQRMALSWVQQYISQFGGDPTQVTVGGGSAGGTSTVMQTLAYGGRNDSLFRAVAPESAASGTIYTVEEADFQFQHLVSGTSCSSNATLECLVALSADDLQKGNTGSFPLPNGNGIAPTYTYGPLIDGDFLIDFPANLFRNGSYLKVPMLIGDAQEEGTIFTSGPVDSYADMESKITANWPAAGTDAVHQSLEKYWPNSDFQDHPPFTQSPGSNSGDYWLEASTAYGEIRYTCPNYFRASAHATTNTPTWFWMLNATTEASRENGLGSQHACTTDFIFDHIDSSDERHDAVRIVQSYWFSFIKHSDPSAELPSDITAWQQWTSGTNQTRMTIRNTVDTSGNEAVPDNEAARCKYAKTNLRAFRQ